MTKQKTAIRQLIEMLNGRIKFFEERQEGSMVRVLKGVKIKAEALESVNEQQIKDAYEMGDKYKFEISGEEWFNQTFEKP